MAIRRTISATAREAAGRWTVVLVMLGTGCSADPTNPTDPIGEAEGVAPASVDADAVVARHIDGDSLELTIDGEVVEVRLAGINAPELADCQGPGALAALADLLDGHAIDVTGDLEDRFGRRLVSLVADGQPVDEALVRAGWALALHDEGSHLVETMRAAADEGIGWWSSTIDGCDPIDGDVRIVDVQPDPAGRDDENLNQEFVVVGSDDDLEIDLVGWALRDESTSNRYVFGHQVLGPGDEVVVHTGCGEDTATDVYWCSRDPVWSNQGETVMLLGPGTTHVDHRFLDGS